MGKGYKHGGSGGVNPLNFIVKAYPSEVELNTATAVANTIGVVTTNPITGWCFSADDPDTKFEGEVWFPVGTSSTVAFNALNKNNIMVYPKSAKQYVSSNWVDVVAKTYKDGKWVNWWEGELYEKGNDFEHITGGWKDYLYFSSYTKGTCTNEEDGFTLTVSGNKYAVARQTVKKIDLTDVKHIELVMEANNSLHKDITITSDNEVTAETRLDNDVATVRRQDVISKDAPITINTEAITGEYYLSIGIYSYDKGAGSVKVISVKTVR